MNSKTVWLLKVGVCFLLLCTFVTAAEYTVTDLGLSESSAYDINNDGMIVVQGINRSAFIWHKGQITNISPDGSAVSSGAINSFGQLSLNFQRGYYGYSFAHLWLNADTHPIQLSTTSAIARDINDNATVIGEYFDGFLDLRRPYIWNDLPNRGGLETLGDNNGLATGINNADPVQVVGTIQVSEGGDYHAFLWTKGTSTNVEMQQLEGLTHPVSVATALNDNGSVVGWMGDRNFELSIWSGTFVMPTKGSHAFFWKNKNEWWDLGTLSTDNKGTSAAYDINIHDQVVGYSQNDLGESLAFVYTVDNGMVDLNSKLPTNSGWLLQVAHAINDKGQIVGWGVLNGQRRAFLLTPTSMIDAVDISIDLSLKPVTPLVNETFTATVPITLINDDTDNLSVYLEINLAPELGLESDLGCIVNDHVLSCDMGEFSPGDTHQFSPKFTLQSDQWGRFPLTVTASAIGPNGVVDIATKTMTIVVTRREPEIATSFAIKDLGTNVSSEDDEGPRINNWGDVVLGGDKGLYYSGGGSKRIITNSQNNQTGDVLVGLNDAGTLVGYKGNGGNLAHMYIKDEWSGFDTMPNDKASEAMALNKDNLVVGFIAQDNNGIQAFSMFPNQAPKLLGDLDSAIGISIARDVNDSGWIVGNSQVAGNNNHAFLYKADDPLQGMIDLMTLGGRESYAYAINNSGIIVGASHDANQQLRAVHYEDGVGWCIIANLMRETKSRALDINESGVAVGSAEVDDAKLAVRYIDNEVQDLNAYLPKDSAWYLYRASGINDAGEIVGVGTFHGEDHGFLMTALTKPPLYSEKKPLELDEGDSFVDVGSAMAIDGDTLAIGTPNYSEAGNDTGAVFIYQRDHENGEWKFRTKLTVKNDSRFGEAVALEGGRLAIASTNNVYIYRGGGVTWETTDDPILVWNFKDLDLNGDVLALVGRNTLYVYRYNGSIWEKEHEVNISYIADDNKGYKSVVVTGNHLFAGFYRNDHSNSSEVNYYRFENDKWVRQKDILSGRRASYGSSLALQDDILVIGALSVGDDQGSVYVFRRRDDGEWVQYDMLSSSGRNDTRPGQHSPIGERFGATVAIHGDLIVVGAPNGNEGEHAAGGIYVFQRHANRWIEEIKLTLDEPVVNQQLGVSVALDGYHVVGGAPNRPDGKVYAYTLKHSPNTADLELLVNTNHDDIGVTEILIYTINVKNLSDADATGVSISLDFPAELKFVSSSFDECTWEADSLRCLVKRIPAGSTHDITVNTEAVEQGLVSSLASVTANQNDPQGENNKVTLDTSIGPEPPPRVTSMILAPYGVVSGTVTLRPNDPLSLEFEVENWGFSKEGTHAHWLLNGEKQGELYSNTSIDLSGLEEKKHTVTVELVGHDHSAIGIEKSVTFTIKRAPWPTVEIEFPPNGKEFSDDPIIQLRYRLDFAGVAQSESDFMLIIDGESPIHLSDPRSMKLKDLSPGEHTIEIKYRESDQADATVTFRIDEIDDVNFDDPLRRNPPTSSGGGGLGVFMVLLILLWHCFAYNYSRRLHG